MLVRSETVLPELPPASARASWPHRKEKRSAASRLRNLKGNKRRYEVCKAAGLCSYGGCRARAKAGHTQCRKHLRQLSQSNRQRYRQRSNQASCIYCGQRPGFWGVRCVICRQRFSRDPLPLGARRALQLYREAEERYRSEQNQVAARLVVRRLLASEELKGKSAAAWRLYAGLDNGQWRSYQKVGHLMGLSKERVRQLLRPAKITLAQILGDNLPWKPLSSVAREGDVHHE